VKYCITGGAGFIGSHLAKYLIKSGHEVLIIDNLSRGKLDNLSDIIKDIEFVKGDITDISSIKNSLKKVDGIFHNAALTSVQESIKNPVEYERINVKGTENIFEIALQLGLKVIFASSAGIYGNTPSKPITESFPTNPINPYGKTKLNNEISAAKFISQGSKIIGLRYFNIFGIGQNLDYAGVISKFFNRIQHNLPPIINGDGTQCRDFIFISDVVESNLLAMKSNIDHGFYNVGTGKCTQILELSKTMVMLSGKDFEPIFSNSLSGDVRFSQANIELIKKELSWVPKTSLVEGLKIFF